MHFSPVSDLPLFPEIFLSTWENFPNFTFSHPFLKKSFPLFSKISSCFRSVYVLFAVFFLPRYFDHDAFMHHTIHVGRGPTRRPWGQH